MGRDPPNLLTESKNKTVFYGSPQGSQKFISFDKLGILSKGSMPKKKNPEKVWSFAKPGGGVKWLKNYQKNMTRGGFGKRPHFFWVFFRHTPLSGLRIFATKVAFLNYWCHNLKLNSKSVSYWKAAFPSLF